MGAFNPFTFKVIIDMYVPIPILLIVWGLFLWVFFLPFSFSCDLMTIFGVVFGLLFLVCVYLLHIFGLQFP